MVRVGVWIGIVTIGVFGCCCVVQIGIYFSVFVIVKIGVTMIGVIIVGSRTGFFIVFVV